MKVTICIGSFCHVKGAPQVIAASAAGAPWVAWAQSHT